MVFLILLLTIYATVVDGEESNIKSMEEKCKGDYKLEQEGNTFMCLKWSYWTDSFEHAKNHCQFSGTRLAVFNTWDKMKILQRRSNVTWIGLDDIQNEGRYIWHNGQEFTDPEHSGFFLRYEPSNSLGIEDCVVYSGNLLNDAPCSMSYLFVCERAL